MNYRQEAAKRQTASIKFTRRPKISIFVPQGQWRRQLVGTWARAPLAFEKFFCYTFKQVVWFGLVLCQTLNLALFVQPYSLWNDTITGYNGACAKVNVVFTARRYALARSLLSSGVRPSVCPPRSCIVSRRLKILSNIFLGPLAPSF